MELCPAGCYLARQAHPRHAGNCVAGRITWICIANCLENPPLVRQVVVRPTVTKVTTREIRYGWQRVGMWLPLRGMGISFSGSSETLVNPETEIPEGASRIHGISNLDVVNSPTMTEVWPELLATVENRLLLCYNVNYDKPLLANEAARRGLTPIDSTWQCVMLRYAAFVGEPGYGGYRYQKLPSAGHRAKDDCLATIELIHKMAVN